MGIEKPIRTFNTRLIKTYLDKGGKECSRAIKPYYCNGGKKNGKL